MTRREFVAAAAAATVPFALPRRGRAATVTVQDVIDRVKAHVGVAWKADTVDTIKAGDPATIVKGIVTTSMATVDVLRRASAAGANLVVTMEPTFFSRADAPMPARGRGQTTPVADPVYDAKRDFIQKNGLVVWRFSDHWRLRQPDPLVTGLAETLGWMRYQDAHQASHFGIPARTLATLAGEIKTSLGSRGGIRVVGDPATRVSTAALLPGSTPITASLDVMPHVDVIVAGEVREWESVVYAQDVVASGRKKGLITIGRVVSEEPSMKLCASWLGTIVPEVKSTWLSVGDPYWRPA